MARSIAGSGDAPPGSLSNDLDLATDGLTKRSGNQGEFSEKHTVIDNNEESSIEEGSKPTHDHTHRKLKPRHVQLIGIGGTIGTALYVQIGRGLANGGPASLFLAFTIWYVLSSPIVRSNPSAAADYGRSEFLSATQRYTCERHQYG
jgi:amino acid transporter